jgi:hypothetical protein
MILLPDFCYWVETEVFWHYETAHFLPALRMGVVLDSSTRPNKLTGDCAGPYQHVVAHMQVRGGGVRRVHRVLYIQVNSEPWIDDGSDNYCRPDSFRPREPLTLPPETFDPGLGVLGPMRHDWTRRIKEVKARWDRYYQALGISPPCSVDRWGETYDLPQF